MKKIMIVIEIVVIIGNLILGFNKLFMMLANKEQKYQSKCVL